MVWYGIKIGKVTPFFKSERKDDLNNYRPITVLPTVARVMERLIYKQIYDYFNTEKLLNENQWGIISLHSTVLALSDCSSDWLFSMDKGMINSVVFLDIKKAFDTVNHKILLDKLSYYGIEEDELSLIKSYLSDRTQCCSINGVKSKFRSISYGVPQGSILGPLLFIIYINDLPNSVKGTEIKMYPDDTNLTKHITSLGDVMEELIPEFEKVILLFEKVIQGSILGPLLFIIYMNDLPNSVKGTEIKMYPDDTNLTKHITSLSDVMEELIPEFEKVVLWLKANKLSLNTLKTEFMFFGSSKRLKDTTNLIALRVGDKLIRRTKKVKYIGVILDEQLTCRDHIDYISAKIKRNIGAIKRIRNSLPKEYLEMLYKTVVKPHFRYCNTVWGHCGDTLLNRLQALQNRAARIISSQRYDNTDHKYLLKNLKRLNV